MSFNNTKRYDPPKRKRILIGETLEEENTRLAKEIAAHPVTKCEPGARTLAASFVPTITPRTNSGGSKGARTGHHAASARSG